MYVRVEKQDGDRPYNSVVYGYLDSQDFSRYIVLNPYSNCFELVDLTGSPDNLFTRQIHIIQPDTTGFTVLSGSALLKLKYFIKKQHREWEEITYICGYRDICEDNTFLSSLLFRKSIPQKQCSVLLRDLPDKDEWTYLNTQEELKHFMSSFEGFHDSTLESIHYSEDDYGTRRILALFCIWFGIISLCFEGVTYFQIKPSDPRMRDILDATLRVSAEEGVFWADSCEPEDPYEGSVIKAYSVKWKRLDTNNHSKEETHIWDNSLKES